MGKSPPSAKWPGRSWATRRRRFSTAQILALEDPEYIGNIAEKIRQEAINAEAAVQAVTGQFLALFADIDDEYLRERGADLRDVSQRLLRRLLGIPAELPADKTEM